MFKIKKTYSGNLFFFYLLLFLFQFIVVFESCAIQNVVVGLIVLLLPIVAAVCSMFCFNRIRLDFLSVPLMSISFILCTLFSNWKKEQITGIMLPLLAMGVLILALWIIWVFFGKKISFNKKDNLLNFLLFSCSFCLAFLLIICWGPIQGDTTGYGTGYFTTYYHFTLANLIYAAAIMAMGLSVWVIPQKLKKLFFVIYSFVLTIGAIIFAYLGGTGWSYVNILYFLILPYIVLGIHIVVLSLIRKEIQFEGGTCEQSPQIQEYSQSERPAKSEPKQIEKVSCAPETEIKVEKVEVKENVLTFDEKLKRLKELQKYKDLGLITDEDLNRKKREILGK